MWKVNLLLCGCGLLVACSAACCSRSEDEGGGAAAKPPEAGGGAKPAGASGGPGAKANATAFISADLLATLDEAPPWRTVKKTVTDPEELRRLVGFFSGLAEDSESEWASGWTTRAEVVFKRTDGSTNKVVTDLDEWAGWDGGSGDVAPEFIEYLEEQYRRGFRNESE